MIADYDIEKSMHPENFLEYNPDEIESNIRKCTWCREELEQGDDLVCGYHHLSEKTLDKI